MERNKKLNEFVDTSQEAYNSIRPTLTLREQEVYDIICELENPNIDDIAEKLETLPHKISGRFIALKRKKIIFVSGQKKNKSGYLTNYYEVI